ncbi:Flp pilus assembly protein CpaB [Acidisphaera sp. L21]|uniref:Flp pilus assembly protein CpaB n=1 Tax=Acidisphaera sp. L21 TaxID=1641851 RepID=UPI00131CFC56|nr:Flp pilus assembly protein CpaB [Acidisphaera sp. L21]
MLLRFAVFGLMALGLGGFGTVAWLSTRPPPAPPSAVADAPPPPVKHLVLAAAAQLRAGTLLKPEDVIQADLPNAPPTAQEDSPVIRAGLTGAMLRRSLGPGEPVLASDVMRPGDHGFLAAVLGPNMRAATVGVDNVSGSAGLIWPGDHVDLILTQTLDDPALPPARRVAAETVLADVRVIAIDQLLARGVAPTENNGGGRTVTLEVTTSQAERIAVANRLGKLSLAVRSADSTETVQAAQSAVVQTTWGGDVSPALGRPTPPTAKDGGSMVRLFQGASDGKEFRF